MNRISWLIGLVATALYACSDDNSTDQVSNENYQDNCQKATDRVESLIENRNNVSADCSLFIPEDDSSKLRNLLQNQSCEVHCRSITTSGNARLICEEQFITRDDQYLPNQNTNTSEVPQCSWEQ